MPRKMYYVERYHTIQKCWIRIFSTPDQDAAIAKFNGFASLVQPNDPNFPEGVIRVKEVGFGAVSEYVACI